jgi:hypothetical protein
MAYKYLANLPPRQRMWFFVGVVASLLICALGVLCEPDKTFQERSQFTESMSIREIAPKLDVTGKGLARELALPLDVPKNKPLNKLGISQEQLDHASAHILSHRSTNLKYYLFAAIVLFGLMYLTRFGRPANGSISERDLWYPRIPYIACLVGAVLVSGFVLGKSPNPMEGTVKVFRLVSVCDWQIACLGLFYSIGCYWKQAYLRMGLSVRRAAGIDLQSSHTP